jgi:bacterioferritin-associated ferredoxin
MNAIKISEITKELPSEKQFLSDLWPNHPFGRVCCKTRKLSMVPCDGTCGDCKKNMKSFIDNELLRKQANEQIRAAGDASYELTDIAIIRKNLEEKIALWKKKKEEIIQNHLKEIKVNEIADARIASLQAIIKHEEAIMSIAGQNGWHPEPTYMQ